MKYNISIRPHPRHSTRWQVVKVSLVTGRVVSIISRDCTNQREAEMRAEGARGVR